MPLSNDFVDVVSTQIGLRIGDGDIERVKEDMARIASIADFLMQFPLGQETEVAPVFQP